MPLFDAVARGHPSAMSEPPAPRTAPVFSHYRRQQAFAWSRTRAAMCRSLFGAAPEGCDYVRTLAK